MNVKEFIEATYGKWVKINVDNETGKYEIRQRIDDAKRMSGTNYYNCKGASVSNQDNEHLFLNEFYMTEAHLGEWSEMTEEEIAKLQDA